MNLLLDTHTFIWAAASPERLPPTVRTLLSDERNCLLLSAASVWEISLKHSLRRKEFVFPEEAVVTALEDLGCRTLVVDVRHALALFRLPIADRDPFDRILFAQAWTDNLVLVTADRQLRQSPEIQTIW